MYEPMYFWYNFVFHHEVFGLMAALAPKSKNLSAASGCILNIICSNLTDARLDDVDDHLMFVFNLLYDRGYLLVDCLFDSAICEFEDHVEVVFVLADVDQILVYVLLVVQEFYLLLDD